MELLMSALRSEEGIRLRDIEMFDSGRGGYFAHWVKLDNGDFVQFYGEIYPSETEGEITGATLRSSGDPEEIMAEPLKVKVTWSYPPDYVIAID